MSECECVDVSVSASVSPSLRDPQGLRLGAATGPAEKPRRCGGRGCPFSPFCGWASSGQRRYEAGPGPAARAGEPRPRRSADTARRCRAPAPEPVASWAWTAETTGAWQAGAAPPPRRARVRFPKEISTFRLCPQTTTVTATTVPLKAGSHLRSGLPSPNTLIFHQDLIPTLRAPCVSLAGDLSGGTLGGFTLLLLKSLQ